MWTYSLWIPDIRNNRMMMKRNQFDGGNLYIFLNPCYLYRDFSGVRQWSSESQTMGELREDAVRN